MEKGNHSIRELTEKVKDTTKEINKITEKLIELARKIKEGGEDNEED